ncbi:MAG: 16S rRNA processing protein RimM [bacterium]|nr:16S rRNA processing protein RimM [bacterium]
MHHRAVRTLPDTVLVGRVVRPHGIRGELKVEIHSDVAERFEPGGELLLVSGAPSARDSRTVRIRTCRPVRRGLLVRIEGCDTRDQAEAIRGARLEVERSRVPEAPAGSYYHYELVGCQCFDERHGDLGRVVDLVEDGGGYLLRVARGDRNLLIPFVAAFLDKVDVAGGRIDLRLPPGLVETCAFGS